MIPIVGDDVRRLTLDFPPPIVGDEVTRLTMDFAFQISVNQRRLAVKNLPAVPFSFFVYFVYFVVKNLRGLGSLLFRFPIRVNPCNPWLKNPFPFKLQISGNQRRLAVKGQSGSDLRVLRLLLFKFLIRVHPVNARPRFGSVVKKFPVFQFPCGLIRKSKIKNRKCP